VFSAFFLVKSFLKPSLYDMYDVTHVRVSGKLEKILGHVVVFRFFPGKIGSLVEQLGTALHLLGQTKHEIF
jgi:hypothetical protein